MYYVIVKKYRRNPAGLRLPPEVACDTGKSGPFGDAARAEQFAVSMAREDSEVLSVEIVQDRDQTSTVVDTCGTR